MNQNNSSNSFYCLRVISMQRDGRTKTSPLYVCCIIFVQGVHINQEYRLFLSSDQQTEQNHNVMMYSFRRHDSVGEKY
jgi:hypothetical protein